MNRKICLLGPLLLAACATPELPGGFTDAQSWFDARVADGAAASAAPASIPDKSPTLSAEQLEQSARAVMQARDDMNESERATRPPVSDTQQYADEARERADPPPPID